MLKSKKPTVFSYGDYVKAEKEIEELKAANEALKTEIVIKDTHIKNLETQLKELRDNGPTVTGLIEVIRNKACNTCVKNAECLAALDGGEDFECSLDIL